MNSLSADEITMEKWSNIKLRVALLDIDIFNKNGIWPNDKIPNWIDEITHHIYHGRECHAQKKLAITLVHEETIRRWLKTYMFFDKL